MSDETPPIPTGESAAEEPEENEPTLTKEEIAWLRNQMQKKPDLSENGQPAKTEIAVLRLEQPPVQSPLEPPPEKKPKSKKSKHADRKRVVNFRLSKD